MFRILVVDDDNNLNNLIAKVLTKNGYQVFQSLNVEKAYDIIDQNYVDLIITDIMMPGTNGYTFTRALRNEKIEIPQIQTSVSTSQWKLTEVILFLLRKSENHFTEKVTNNNYLRSLSCVLWNKCSGKRIEIEMLL